MIGRQRFRIRAIRTRRPCAHLSRKCAVKFWLALLSGHGALLSYNVRAGRSCGVSRQFLSMGPRAPLISLWKNLPEIDRHILRRIGKALLDLRLAERIQLAQMLRSEERR